MKIHASRYSTIPNPLQEFPTSSPNRSKTSYSISLSGSSTRATTASSRSPTSTARPTPRPHRGRVRATLGRPRGRPPRRSRRGPRQRGGRRGSVPEPARVARRRPVRLPRRHVRSDADLLAPDDRPTRCRSDRRGVRLPRRLPPAGRGRLRPPAEPLSRTAESRPPGASKCCEPTPERRLAVGRRTGRGRRGVRPL